jgi:hypothetical protein
MNAARTGLTALVLILGMALNPASAEDWKSITKDQGVELAYQATGNLARLRFTNSSNQPMTVNWKLQVQLGTGNSVDNQGELNLGAGETEIVASTPYRDAGHPAEVKSVSGTIAAKKMTP